jgi:class 3 adenylate cyclase
MTLAAPLGSVTLMFTDIEGSTKLLERLRDNYAVVLEQHRDLMRASFERWGGYEVDTQGDSFFVAFALGFSSGRMRHRGAARAGWP